MGLNRFCNPVLLILTIFLTLILFTLPFISLAENRLVIGKPYRLFSFPMAISGYLWLLLMLLWCTTFYSKRYIWLICTLLLSAAFIATMQAIAGFQATTLTRFASPATRVAIGSGFWCATALALLISAEAIRNLTINPLLRLLFNALLWLFPTILLFNGYLENLSLLKEYATHRSAFAQALSRHLLLLGITLTITLVIGLPLGIWLAKQSRLGRPSLILALLSNDSNHSFDRDVRIAFSPISLVSRLCVLC